jgi:hypothetical protein
MGSQFTKIITETNFWEVIDELSTDCEDLLETAKSDIARAVIELGYKRCLHDIMSKLPTDKDGCLFVDKNEIHVASDGNIPYEDPSITPVNIYRQETDWECIKCSEEIPDDVYINGVKYTKAK